jgi:predicted RNA-binding Zn ribbon-like protein
MLPETLKVRRAAQAEQVAGRLCLDFANLVGGWNDIETAREDRLTEYADLVAFAWKAGLVDDAAAAHLWRCAQARARETAAVLSRARRLRGAIHAIAWNFERERPQRESDLLALGEEVRIARDRQRLQPADGRLEWRLSEEAAALDAPLWPVALSAESYFTSADLSRLHSCPGEDCGWHFEDQTRNRSRRWCDMGDCGNVAKVRRFRSKVRPRRAR